MCSIQDLQGFSSAHQGYEGRFTQLVEALNESANEAQLGVGFCQGTPHHADFDFLGKRGRLKLETVLMDG
ncbi:MAG: hypothetical protein ACYTFO_02520, partial [Planctomycetota bacterium]